MLRLVQVDQFRGFEAPVELELAPLTVLMGPNGGGKSSLLDAVHIGASPTPGDAVWRAVRRRRGPVRGARWLLPRADVTRVAKIRVADGDQSDRLTRAKYEEVREVDDFGVERPGADPQARIVLAVMPWSAAAWEGPADRATVSRYVRTTFVDHDRFTCESSTNGSRQWSAVPERASTKQPWVRLIDVRARETGSDEAEQLDAAVRMGVRDDAVALLRSVVPALTSLELLLDNVVALVLKDRGAVPVALAGDGVAAAVRLALELGIAPPGGSALLEEPEAFLHPRAARLVADLIAASVNRGVQVVLSTHSLEFLDLLLEAARAEGDDALARLRVVRVRPGADQFVSYEGPQVAEIRSLLDEDLR